MPFIHLFTKTLRFNAYLLLLLLLLHFTFQVECKTKCQERKPLTKPPDKLTVQSKEFILQYQTGPTNLSLLSYLS